MRFLNQPTRCLFFTGKGGVGKTTVACATAIKLADTGKKVLLVSTDPASNLDEVLGSPLTNQPTVVPAVANLFAMNLDPEQAAAEYRERMVGPYRGILPEAALKSMEEQLSGSCTTEIAAFDQFSRLLGDPDATANFDHVVFDTAPTGHTLRLLTLPSAWQDFIEHNTTGTSCLGPLAGLQHQRNLYQQTVAALGDKSSTTLVLVTRPEPSALREAARTSTELAQLGILNQHLVINGVFEAGDSKDTDDPYATALQVRGAAALANMPDELRTLNQSMLKLHPISIVGIDALRKLDKDSNNQSKLNNSESHSSDFAGLGEARSFDLSGFQSLKELVDGLATAGHGVVLTMGKGGVGKTTIAAAVAVALAERGYEVQLSTTDPAAHVAATLAGDILPNLSVSRIDPQAETSRYAAEIMEKAGAGLDEHGKRLLEEELRSPCTEEIAVFRAFAEVVAAGTKKFVVLDTAPTGHTILLLDSALAYHREVSRQSSGLPEAVEHLLPRLRDPEFTRILILTLPEATPVHEAAALQQDLRRAAIEPYGWIVNQAFSPLKITDPVLKKRQLHEQQYLREILDTHAGKAAIIPWKIDTLSGAEALKQLASTEPEKALQA